MTDFVQLFEQFRSIKVGVLGDVMLDTYMWGHVDRISPEAPVPVVLLDEREQRIGGAGNVALNLQSLGAAAYLISVTGNDSDAGILKTLLSEKKINSSYLVTSAQRITTNKTRIISRNQQMMRLDAEITTDLSTEEENNLLRAFQKFLATEKPQVVILEDYNKGVLTERVITEAIALCKQHDVLTAVDPKRKNFFAYRGVDLFKPNLKEIKDAFNLLADASGKGEMDRIHQQLQQQLNHQISFITLSEKGVYYHNGTHSEIIPSHRRNIADVSGAGDTVIATAALVYAATKDVKLMASLANLAGGLVCEEVGTAAIDAEKLRRECGQVLSSGF